MASFIHYKKKRPKVLNRHTKRQRQQSEKLPVKALHSAICCQKIKGHKNLKSQISNFYVLYEAHCLNIISLAMFEEIYRKRRDMKGKTSKWKRQFQSPNSVLCGFSGHIFWRKEPRIGMCSIKQFVETSGMKGFHLKNLILRIMHVFFNKYIKGI